MEGRTHASLRIPIPLIAITCVFLTFACSNEERDTVSTSAKNTPEEAVKSLLSAARSGDVAAIGQTLGGRSRAMFDLMKATEVYWNALDERFGGDNDSGAPPSLKDEMSGIVRANETIEVRGQAKINSTTVAITIWKVRKHKPDHESIWEETWHTVLENGRWKIVLPPKGRVVEEVRTDSDGRERKVEVLKTREFDAARHAEEVSQLTRLRQRVEQVTQEIRAGKCESRQAAQEAVQSSDAEIEE